MNKTYYTCTDSIGSTLLKFGVRILSLEHSCSQIDLHENIAYFGNSKDNQLQLITNNNLTKTM